MEFIDLIDFSDIFEGEMPNTQDLISDIPSVQIIELLSYWSAELHSNNDINTQLYLLKQLFTRQSIEELEKINFKIATKIRSTNKQISLLNKLCIKSFIHYELVHFRELEELPDLTPIQELNIYKAYLVFASLQNGKTSDIFTQIQNNIDTSADFFQSHTWPILVNQFDTNINPNPIASIIKAIDFFNQLQYHHEGTTIFVENFLKEKGVNNSWEYVFSISNLLMSFLKNDSGCKHYVKAIHKNQELMLDEFCVKIEKYKAKYKDAYEEYSMLKSKPLFKSNEKYIVLDVNYISNKIFDGLIFDFYEHSGIKDKYSSFLDFKNFIGKNIIEKSLFQSFLKYILSKKYSDLIFPLDNSALSEVDACYRVGNNVLIFEIKDALFPTSVINKPTYNGVIEVVNQKYNNKKKGTSQLKNQIELISKEKVFKSSSFKTRNFKIYPILVYTDPYFGMPGISNYLQGEFKENIANSDLQKKFKKINHITFISLDFIIINSSFLRNENIFNLIEQLHCTLSKTKEKEKKNRSIDNLFKSNNSHDTVLADILKLHHSIELDIQDIINKLNLTEGLPS